MVGFIGIGIMGKHMAKNLLSAHYDLLVYDVVEEATHYAVNAGAKLASVAEIGEKCEVIFLSLPNGSIVQSVVLGEGGLIHYIKEGAVIADTSSITPAESKLCHQSLGKIGVGYIDCPVSGGEPGAQNGTLAFMAGGSKKDFDMLKPYFEVLGRSAVLVGESGSGSVAKLANQVIVNTTIAAVSEALVLAVKCGTDPDKVFNAIRGGLAGSQVLEDKAPMMITRNFRPGGSLTINRKDIKNVMSAAEEVGAPMFLTSQLFEIMQALRIAGHSDEDHSAIVRFYEQLAGVEVSKKD